MIQTLDSLSEVREFAESPVKDTRTIEQMGVGEWVRQGDVYIERINEANPGWKQTNNRQLAIGTTMGSRHVIDRAHDVVVLVGPNNGKVARNSGLSTAVCIGPQIVAEARFVVSHPEHADFDLPAGTYQVRFQVDPQSQQRVQD
jgi:hypothetical protein